jgi:hypothetical protein
MALSYTATRKVMYHFYVSIMCLDIVIASDDSDLRWHQLVNKYSYNYSKNGVK